MRAVLLATLMAARIFASPGDAGRHAVTLITFNGTVSLSTLDTDGDNRRSEHVNPDGSHRITILKPKTVYELDPRSQEYATPTPLNSWILSLAQWIARPPHFDESGKTVNVYYETIDTGERREFFGQTAKHLQLRTRAVAEPGACQPSSEMTRDGWYLPADQPKGATGYILTGINNHFCRDTIVSHGRPPYVGIPVRETWGDVTTEVLELSSGPLDPSLFEVPANYRKVEVLRGSQMPTPQQRRQMEWARLGSAIESWWQ